MYIILGATGHIGSVVAKTLLKQNEAVTVITRNQDKVHEWEQLGAKVAVVDVFQTDELRSVLQQAKRLFLLNPPAPPDTDTSKRELDSIRSILSALTDSGIEKVVAQSTYGAQPGDQIGDLGVLYEMEQHLSKIGIPATIIRGAYYMSNWDMSLVSAREEGKLYTFFPADFSLPMVAPEDLGHVAAQLITSDSLTGIYHVEGPEQYSVADVATVFSVALKRPVEVVTTPRSQWESVMMEVGFSKEAAQSFAGMTDVTLQKGPEIADSPIRGAITLQTYIRQLVVQQ
ncbi:NmrA family NAD(P)-binding protein [Cytophagaceae bacterium YF14B1]|uniref:NmrA family NAD(P)-binding protein n=1 Tax=Xanthocytophaga flava TaxID=3048013 RepID=A0AAE3QTT3_9BACT|nr:NmrA family NAD(P)-binding protein [Xanthocytophaga flavus]MDJ1482513.1 NmrA family NAD(P)-binding protein [Xanthocytophaga flavus]